MLFSKDKSGCYFEADTEDIIFEATEIYNASFRRGQSICDPEAAKQMIKLKLVHYEYEVFACLYLDNQHRVLAFEELFRGTLDGTAVYPREVVKAALRLNAGAVIFAHNHPSGIAEPSQADRNITEKLIKALGLVDIRVLDHLVVGETVTSMAERGML